MPDAKLRLYRVQPFDDLRTRWAKLTANRGRIAERHPKRPRHKRLLDIEAQLWQLGATAAADPLYRDELVGWDVTVTADWQVEDAAEQLATRLGSSGAVDPSYSRPLSELISTLSGGMADLVRSALCDWGHDPDCGFCDHAWHVDVLVSDSEAARVCALLHREFAHEIRSGALHVRRDFAGYGFDALLWPEAAEHWLKVQARRRRGATPPGPKEPPPTSPGAY